jgi:hypothetical protein
MRGSISGCSLYPRTLSQAASIALLGLVASALSVGGAHAQVFVVQPEHIEGHYLEFHPTDIALSTEPITERTRRDLLRFLTAEQGFAMRPLPVGNLTIHANGDMQPAGSDYVNELHSKGISVNAAGRVTITDVKIHEDRIVLDLNGGPDHKHRYLRHISIGADPTYTTPIVRDDEQEPTGSRVTLVFHHTVPEVTGMQVESLLKPLIDFGVKTPLEAYTDTLPPFLKNAILAHHVLVGMNTDMLLSAKGEPNSKVREMDGQMPFEEWIYGQPPAEVEFVRINGNRVIRVEDASVGKSPVIRTADEMGDYWNTQPNPNIREVKLGDQSPAAAAEQDAKPGVPTLREPGEKLPTDGDKDHPVMAPVNFPKDTQADGQQKPQSTPSTTTQQPASSNPPASQQTTPAAQSTPPPSSSPQQNYLPPQRPSGSG